LIGKQRCTGLLGDPCEWQSSRASACRVRAHEPHLAPAPGVAAAICIQRRRVPPSARYALDGHMGQRRHLRSRQPVPGGDAHGCGVVSRRQGFRRRTACSLHSLRRQQQANGRMWRHSGQVASTTQPDQTRPVSCRWGRSASPWPPQPLLLCTPSSLVVPMADLTKPPCSAGRRCTQGRV
jgi:hypothetical protein